MLVGYIHHSLLSSKTFANLSISALSSILATRHEVANYGLGWLKVELNLDIHLFRAFVSITTKSTPLNSLKLLKKSHQDILNLKSTKDSAGTLTWPNTKGQVVAVLWRPSVPS